MSSMKSTDILGIRVHSIRMADAMDAIAGFIRERGPHIVVTADASAAVLARRDSEFREIVNTADLVTPDSTGMLWASKRFGDPLPERVSGVDIVTRICERGATEGYRVFLLGSAPGVTADAADRLAERYPGLVIAGTYHGYFTQEETPAVLDMIRAAQPDVLFVAMGIPMQEKWIHRHMQSLMVPVSIGVGGSFDVISGRVNRAPVWMQRHGLEWLHRLVSNPKKIQKCKHLPVFVAMVLGARRSGGKTTTDV